MRDGIVTSKHYRKTCIGKLMTLLITQSQSLETPPATQMSSTAITIITDIANWNHPVKSVMQQNSITIKKVELKNNKTYPMFYVTMQSESYIIDYVILCLFFVL
ncbi:MAG TPA: hypothetical protein VIO64_00460 [Pseudobacteroides sp.]|uniref:hypothetical protein n=1 Tax=Pseudobacteroides sp. TaxID=1968840 RepID=UPI002F933C23